VRHCGNAKRLAPGAPRQVAEARVGDDHVALGRFLVVRTARGLQERVEEPESNGQCGRLVAAHEAFGVEEPALGAVAGLGVRAGEQTAEGPAVPVLQRARPVRVETYPSYSSARAISSAASEF